MKQVINNKPELKNFRKELRNHGTPAEATLWKYLQKSQLDNRKFRRQHSLGNFITDGEGHFHEPGITKDKIKEGYLNSLGIRVLRFENRLVFEDIEGILKNIKEAFNHP